jgi:hypothetical protein
MAATGCFSPAGLSRWFRIPVSLAYLKRFLDILMAPGPRMTMNRAGIIKSIMGKRIFTGNLAAISSAL